MASLLNIAKETPGNLMSTKEAQDPQGQWRPLDQSLIWVEDAKSVQPDTSYPYQVSKVAMLIPEICVAEQMRGR